VEKALTAVVHKTDVQGVSTRSVDELVQAMGMTGISKSQVSRLCAEIDDKVKVFLSRPIEGDWPYLWIDATDVNVRQSGRVVSVAVIIAVDVNGDGRREILDLDIGPSEAETFWTTFLRQLARRGLRGVKLVISDAHEGIKAAVSKVLNATWQRCTVGLLNKPAFPAFCWKAYEASSSSSRGCRLDRLRVPRGGRRAPDVQQGRQRREQSGGQPLEVDGRAGQVGLGLHILEAAPNGCRTGCCPSSLTAS
jgi:transposase-like protein